jgi:hypothetical protein
MRKITLPLYGECCSAMRSGVTTTVGYLAQALPFVGAFLPARVRFFISKNPTKRLWRASKRKWMSRAWPNLRGRRQSIRRTRQE